MIDAFTFYTDPDYVRSAHCKVEPLQAEFCNFLEGDVPVAVEVVFLDEEQMRELNAQSRGVDAVTDVLSFPSLNLTPQTPLKGKDFPLGKDEEGNLFLGSIVLCEGRAREQAAQFGHSYERELHYLLVHGVLHCLGYDHIQEADKAQMRSAEEAVLSAVGITRETDEV